MIYCIWYPSGGFGHFVNGIISMYGQSFARPNTQGFEFGSNGNAHALELVAPKYLHDPKNYHFDFAQDLNYTVLIDNGIDNEGEQFLKVFPQCTVIKICYSEYTWPILARTMIEKAMNQSFDKEIFVDDRRWPSNKNWALREKYFLFLRDHKYRFMWKPNKKYYNLELQDFLTYQNLKQSICSTGIVLDQFENLWQEWKQKNIKYLMPVIKSYQIIEAIEKKQNVEIMDINNVWIQAVVYYYIWLKYNFEVPHNDYCNWFTNTTDIVKMLNKYGIKN